MFRYQNKPGPLGVLLHGILALSLSLDALDDFYDLYDAATRAYHDYHPNHHHRHRLRRRGLHRSYQKADRRATIVLCVFS